MARDDETVNTQFASIRILKVESFEGHYGGHTCMIVAMEYTLD
jgi:hypothetical protein